MADTSLTALTANFTLPNGVTGKIRGFGVDENFRWKDSEGFEDGGYQTGKLTGQGLNVSVTGFVKSTALGIGTRYDQVSFVAIADSGRQIPFTGSITDIRWGAQVGEVQTFSATVRSSGSYTNSGV